MGGEKREGGGGGGGGGDGGGDRKRQKKQYISGRGKVARPPLIDELPSSKSPPAPRMPRADAQDSSVGS